MDSSTIKLDRYLREQTAILHKQTEEVLKPLELFTNFNLNNYGVFVRIQYYWHLIVEKILMENNPALLFDGYSYSPKVEFLHKDIKALNIPIEEKNYGGKMEGEVPGILYVVEGSMLGGTMISNHLEACGVDLKYRNYFSYCNEAAKRDWPLTRKYLQAIEQKDSNFERILESSHICFELMRDIAVAEINPGLEWVK